MAIIDVELSLESLGRGGGGVACSGTWFSSPNSVFSSYL